MFSCEIGHNRKGLVSVFQEFSASINKTFILTGDLCTGLSFHVVERNFLYFLISYDPKSYDVHQSVRQLVYNMFISNNRPKFHLWWKGNLVKHCKIRKKTPLPESVFLVKLRAEACKFLKTSFYIEHLRRLLLYFLSFYLRLTISEKQSCIYVPIKWPWCNVLQQELTAKTSSPFLSYYNFIVPVLVNSVFAFSFVFLKHMWSKCRQIIM